MIRRAPNPLPAFVVPDESGQADWELRWFAPEVEVGLCGHATLASGHVLLALEPLHEVTAEDSRFPVRLGSRPGSTTPTRQAWLPGFVSRSTPNTPSARY
jgi:predicted PhzF superfamily epimerase YddE/YHI9